MSRELRTRAMWMIPAAFVAACVTTSGDKEPFPFDELIGEEGKADMVSRAHLIDDIDLNSSISGRIDRRIRVHGFTFEARAGAVIHLDIEAIAGSDSFDLNEGAALDTVAAAYGPMDGDEPGPELAYSDDTVEGAQARLPALQIEHDGRYVVVFSTWDDPGNGFYEVEVGCEGTDFQCRRPVEDVPCVEGTRYITGGTVIGTETWTKCNVVLLEETHVAEDAVLTVRPGVHVQGNFLGTPPYGEVRLVVDGTIQAVGTEEHPVRFSSLRDGWGGLVINGSSNSLEHVYVEEAQRGIDVRGSSNIFTNLNVNSCETGITIGEGSLENVIERVRIDQVETAISIEGGAVEIIDSVLLGQGGGIGIRGVDGEQSIFRRTLLAGFEHGLHLSATALEVYDGTITNNTRGVTVTGVDSGVHPAHECPAFPSLAPQPPYRPAPPARWYPDPVFIRCDFVGNSEYAIRIDAPELLVVEGCNIWQNGAGIIVAADTLHEESRIRESNIFDNGDGPAQVESFHTNGVLDISGNYWAQISDPELSASWAVNHHQDITCRETLPSNRSPGNYSCSYNSSTRRYTCGSYDCPNSRGATCTSTLTASWEGQIVFTGFSPEELEAGPSLQEYTDQVLQERTEQGL